MNWYLKALNNYFVFDGRAHRTEFWMFVLFNLIFIVSLSFIDGILGFTGGAISTLYSLVVFIPSLTLSVRRLHDINLTGWTVLIGIIPVLGWIVLIVLYVLDSNPGENKYGPNPWTT